MFFSSLLKRRALNIFGALLVLASVFAVSSCSQVDDDDPVTAILKTVSPLQAADSICGKWQDGYTSWNTYGDCDYEILPASMGTSSYEKHAGTVYIRKTSASSGYLYYQLDHDITGYDSSYNSITVPSTGKWCATAYKDLTATSVKLSDAYKASSTYDFPSTLTDCVLKYTIENGYFDNMPACTKVAQ